MRRLQNIFFIFSSILAFQWIPSPLISQSLNKDSVDWERNLQTIVITGQFLPTDIRKTVQNVRILDQKIIERQASISLGDLLATQPNIKINNDPILGGAISMNGLNGQNFKILVDGVPIVGKQNGSMDINQILLAGVKKIEILQGSQSVMYGSDAAAGVINIITTPNNQKKYAATIQGQYESQGLHTENVLLGMNSEKLNIQLIGNYLEFKPDSSGSGRDQIWNPKKQYAAQFNTVYKPIDKLKLNLNSRFLDERVVNLGSVVRPQYKPYSIDDQYFTKRLNINFSGDYSGVKNHSIQTTVGYDGFFRRKNRDRFNFFDSSTETVVGEQDTASSIGWLARATIASDFAQSKFNYQFGLENFYEQATGNKIRKADSLSKFAKINNLSVFSNLQYQPISKLKIQAGARLNKNDNYGYAFIPSFSMFYKINSSFDARVSYAYGYRSPDLKELYFEFIDVNHYVIGNQYLKPESSRNLWGQIAYKYTKENYEIRSNLDGFYNSIYDKIALVQIGKGNEYGYKNFYNWKTAGGSINASFIYKNRLSFTTTLLYTGYFDTASKDSSNYKTLLWTPDVVNEFWVNILPAKSLIFTIWHKYNGYLPQYIETDNNQIMLGGIGSWNNLNISLSIKPIKRIQLTIGAKNLTDVKQIAYSATGEPHSGTTTTRDISLGRSFFIATKIDLGSK